MALSTGNFATDFPIAIGVAAGGTIAALIIVCGLAHFGPQVIYRWCRERINSRNAVHEACPWALHFTPIYQYTTTRNITAPLPLKRSESTQMSRRVYTTDKRSGHSKLRRPLATDMQHHRRTTLNVTTRWRVDGPLGLGRAFDRAVNRHDALRTCFFATAYSSDIQQHVTRTKALRLTQVQSAVKTRDIDARRAFDRIKEHAYALETGDTV
ncbi:hypothetical protein GGR51DRAFT_556734 [Nemania sp. FL0031]|nr:hypothetical protein GGR51DRAFT_556734 [Nemania sp. FL0031]